MPLAERPGVTMAGFGHCLPERRVENAEIEADLGLPPGWIEARSGIRARHYAAPDQALSDLAVPGGRMALDQAGAGAAEVGLLLLATSTPITCCPPPRRWSRIGWACLAGRSIWPGLAPGFCTRWCWGRAMCGRAGKRCW